MTEQVKILAFAGSNRQSSVNKQLLSSAIHEAENQGAKVTRINLEDFDLPIYSSEIEAESGLPEATTELSKLVLTHNALLIASPEYNGFMPPLLINLLTWVSRAPGGVPAVTFSGKPVAIMAASPGGLGGVRVIPRLRDYLTELGCLVLPGFVILPQAHTAFDEAGTLQNELARTQLTDLTGRLIKLAEGVD